MSVGTAALSLPVRPDRLALQTRLLEQRTVEAVVRAAPDQRVEYVICAIDLREREGCSMGAALAGIRRARTRGDVRIDDNGRLILGDEGPEAA